MNIFFSLIVNLAMAASPYSSLIDLPKEMPDSLKSAVERDFELLSECEFKNSTPLFNEMFKLNEAKNFDPAWFRQRVTKVGADSRVNANAEFGRGLRIKLFQKTCGGDSKPDTVTLGPFYFYGSQGERIATLIHEARHADGCVHSKLPEIFTCADELPLPTKEVCNDSHDGQCDDAYNGAAGAQMIFLVNFARNCVGDLKEVEKLKFRAFSMIRKILNVSDRKKLAEDLFSADEIEKYGKLRRGADGLSSPLLILDQIKAKTGGQEQICAPK